MIIPQTIDPVSMREGSVHKPFLHEALEAAGFDGRVPDVPVLLSNYYPTPASSYLETMGWSGGHVRGSDWCIWFCCAGKRLVRWRILQRHIPARDGLRGFDDLYSSCPMQHATKGTYKPTRIVTLEDSLSKEKRAPDSCGVPPIKFTKVVACNTWSW